MSLQESNGSKVWFYARFETQYLTIHIQYSLKNRILFIIFYYSGSNLCMFLDMILNFSPLLLLALILL